MSGPCTARPLAKRARRARLAGRRRGWPLAWLALGLALSLLGCREKWRLPDLSREGASAGAPTRDPLVEERESEAAAGHHAGVTSAQAGAGPAEVEPQRHTCPGRPAPKACVTSGSSREGVHLIGTVLTPSGALGRGVLALDAMGNVSCAACECGEAGDALVIDCPDVVIAPGLINLHDHLSYAGTPPLAHPGELYAHRSEWRLGEGGHAALPFEGRASSAEVLAQELRMVLGGATSIVGAGGRRGLLRNLDMAGLSEGLLPGAIRAETFPLDDARTARDPQRCEFGTRPDSSRVATEPRAYVPHLGEGTNERAADELRCALGQLGLVPESAALVHAMALDRRSAEELARRRASVVWSPRSNLDLYGSTAPVGLLSGLGLRIALGTDWLASGSMNLLRELACVRAYDEQVLGGRFDAEARLRMVTEDAAWALGLERRLGELRPGAAGDVALFTERGDGASSVVDATVADVRLVLRQGRPLYGAESLVLAFEQGQACEPLDVCGHEQRVCSQETGLSLDEIIAAGSAVYPLFSCDEPPSEPSCTPHLERECPFGEASCDAPPPPRRLRDSDQDGVDDRLDLCPRVADPAQADSDGDGHGDACDPCPVPNPGQGPCPTSIARLRAGATRLPLGTAVLLEGVRVTAVRAQGSRGYYVEDGDRAPFSGLFVYTGSAAPAVAVNDVISVQGYFSTYRELDELIEPELLLRRAGEPYAPLEVELGQLADGSPDAPSFASLLVRVVDVEVASSNPDAPSDYDETELLGGLRLDDLLFPELDNLYAVGTRWAWVQGVAGRSFSHQKLWPRGHSDFSSE